MEREDYFSGEFQENDRKKVYALVIYDITDNKTRTKFEKLLSEIPKYCSSLDTIRVYRITGKNLVDKWGIDNSSFQEETIII